MEVSINFRPSGDREPRNVARILSHLDTEKQVVAGLFMRLYPVDEVGILSVCRGVASSRSASVLRAAIDSSITPSACCQLIKKLLSRLCNF